MMRVWPVHGESSVILRPLDPVLALPEEDEEPWEDEEEDEDEEDEDEEEDEEPGWLVAGTRPAAPAGIGLASPC